ncbi:hypothetical protein AB0929_04315 [Streptomyces massasporeus]|uniref:hypothetical protein n=1 Tax=Streptomyces massasporeus TaxID=67324 RepID=UPI0034538F0D
MRPPPTGRGVLGRRLPALHVSLVALLTAAYVAVPVLRTPSWALIGLAGVAAVLAGTLIHRPPPSFPAVAAARRRAADLHRGRHLRPSPGVALLRAGPVPVPGGRLAPQGFLFARPLTVEQGEAMLREHDGVGPRAG